MTPPEQPTVSRVPGDAAAHSVGDVATVTGQPAADDDGPLTVTREAGAGAAAIRPDPPPGFTIERELGVGGMGAVYLAKQVGLNRPVALKLVRAGEKADAKALIRFLAEAEAVAAVRHPNVVEVYAYGDHQGKPYMALEFCGGGDLTALTAATPAPDADWFRRVADLMAGVAAGVQAAHAAGIVHRDLKPGNVLLTADGRPKVADFGLAKRGVGSDLTRTHAVMGTPAYMSPEQAGGGGKFVGPESDVWALGVMLYELCCGERPFDGGNVMEVLAAVAAANVPPLKSKCPAVPPDLALIAHKCLQKEAKDRYPTAGTLAADLRNWLDGKPISARPAGVVEQAVKWAKRNKKLAGMGLAVLLTMAAATAVSVGFGLDANEHRTKAEDAARRADEKAADAERSNEQTQRTLAAALLAPIDSDGVFKRVGVYEQNALWQLATLRDGPVPLFLFADATSSPLAAAQLRSRAVLLDHAVVGLDSRRRAAADDLIAACLRDPAAPANLKRDVAVAAVETGRVTDAAVAEQLLAALDRAKTDGDRWQMANSLAKLCERLPPATAAEVCDRAVRRLAIPCGADSDRDAGTAGQAMALVGKYLPADRAVEVFTTALKPATDSTERQFLTQGLAEAAERVLADRGAEVLLVALRGAAHSYYDWEPLTQSLMVVAGRLPAERATAVCEEAAEVLALALKSADDTGIKSNIARGLAVVAGRLPRDRAERVCGAEALVKQLTAASGLDPVGLVAGLIALCPQLPAEAAAAALLTALGTDLGNTQFYEYHALAIATLTAAGRLPTDRAAAVYEQAMAHLAAALKRTTRWYLVDELGRAIAAVGWHLPTDKAAEACGAAADHLAATLKTVTDSADRRYITSALADVAVHLPPARAAELCGQAADILLPEFRTGTAYNRQYLTTGLLPLVRRLPLARRIEVLTGVLDLPGRNLRDELVKRLAAAAAELPTEKAVALFVARLQKATDDVEVAFLVIALAAAAERLPPDDAAKVCEPAAAKVLAALNSDQDQSGQLYLCQALAAVAARRPAVRGVELLTAGLNTVVDEYERSELTHGLRAVCLGLSPSDYLRHRHPVPFAAVAGIAPIHPAVVPTPRPLPAQTLVDLLKHPFCVKEARRAVLDALEVTYDRKFADLWEFVAFAEKEHPDLDLLTPPKRPAKK